MFKKQQNTYENYEIKLVQDENKLQKFIENFDAIYKSFYDKLALIETYKNGKYSSSNNKGFLHTLFGPSDTNKLCLQTMGEVEFLYKGNFMQTFWAYEKIQDTIDCDANSHLLEKLKILREKIAAILSADIVGISADISIIVGDKIAKMKAFLTKVIDFIEKRIYVPPMLKI